ncbi:MAG: carbohydrate ABC transporter permease [Burkholderiales bacterium]|nr:carbohydrate ABC transporter permease [Rhodocyclaceae bacterium]MCA3021931.1 carbohydrate ABC transporter permease [Rhodocyclaceae bacterium]MCA3052204.1 carbohydrate ABC transporter permease [Rhodocyclaceae bacterium]MCA3057005.1 carbohydrate ABC transporter permease [Rhodocyclaceae bacterium]MCA3083512.1 carbohydrate ABC transporter permease [Rhodocyclaceae bacterium]
MKKPNLQAVLPLLLRYLAILIVLLFTVGPFLWLLSTSLKSTDENIFAYPPVLIPQSPTLDNFFRVIDSQPFFTYLKNSALVAVLSVALNLLLASLAAYPLARIPFKGRSVLFIVLLSSMMIPFQLLMIPVYELAISLGLQNTYLGLVLPHACTAFGIFFLRQAFLSVPVAIEEAAIMDGVSRLRIWWFVMLPLIKPSLATLAVFSFIAVWGDFLWPLIIIDQPSLFTLPLGVNRLASTFSLDWRLVAAGAVFSIVPILLFFTFTQRFFIEGAMKGAVKG